MRLFCKESKPNKNYHLQKHENNAIRNNNIILAKTMNICIFQSKRPWRKNVSVLLSTRTFALLHASPFSLKSIPEDDYWDDTINIYSASPEASFARRCSVKKLFFKIL